MFYVTNMNLLINDIEKKWNFFKEKKRYLFDDFFYKKYLVKCKVSKIVDDVIFIEVPGEYTKKILIEKEVDKIFSPLNKKVEFFSEKSKIKSQKVKKSNYTFDNLVVGAFNEKVVRAAKEILAGKNWSPVFIYSEPGLGKTHILKAIINEGEKEGKSCRYINANEFGSFISEKFYEKNGSDIEKLKKSFDENQIILFDDIQLLSCREKTNEILFQIFCKAIDEEKTIVFSSDQHPEELNGFEKRLKSRFLNGLNCKIDYPNETAAEEIVLRKAAIFFESKNILDKDTVYFIAKHFKKDIRKIEGCVKKLAFNFNRVNKKINLNEFKKIFDDQKWIFEQKISVNKIKKNVTKFYKVDYSSVVNGSRKSEIVKARSVAMYLIRKLTSDSFVQIASQFNTKNHTTAVNAIKKIKNQISKSKILKDEIQHLEKICKEK